MLRIARIAPTLLALACSSRGPAPEPPAPPPVAVAAADAAVDAARGMEGR